MDLKREQGLHWCHPSLWRGSAGGGSKSVLGGFQSHPPKAAWEKQLNTLIRWSMWEGSTQKICLPQWTFSIRENHVFYREQENLDSFLAFAEELQLKGLIGKRNKKSMILKWMNSPFPQHKWSILKWLLLFQICPQRDKLQAANKLNLKTVRQLQSLATIMQTWTTLKKQWSRWWRKVRTNTPMENNSLTNAKCKRRHGWIHQRSYWSKLPWRNHYFMQQL